MSKSKAIGVISHRTNLNATHRLKYRHAGKNIILDHVI